MATTRSPSHPGAMMFRPVRGCVLLVLSFAALLHAQEAPLLTVLPASEQTRQYELRADLQMIRKNYWQALDLYQEALKFSRDNPVLLNKIGIAYHQLARLKDAKKYYKRATKADPDYAEAWNNLGTVSYADKNFKDAIKKYRRALKLSPARASIHSNLGAALFARKKYDDAMEEFRLAVLLNPNVFQERSLFGILMQDFSVEDRGRFHFLLAKSFATIGNIEQALFYLRHSLEEGVPAAEAQSDPAFFLLSEDRRFQTLFQQPPATLQP